MVHSDVFWLEPTQRVGYNLSAIYNINHLRSGL